VKEAIFHPEARAEMRESIEFYEARLEGLGLRFLLAVEQTAERIFTHPEAGAPLAGEFRKRIVPGFPITSSIVFGRITSTLLQSLTITVVRVIGATDPLVANHQLEESLCAPQPKR
jgi:hypothetical protein